MDPKPPSDAPGAPTGAVEPILTGARPTWDTYFLALAQQVATRATCPRKRVGAVIVDTRSKHILTTGYNGAPRGLSHCLDVGCEMFEGHCVRTIHAEANAFMQAAFHGISTQGSTLYTTASLCYPCTNLAIAAGVIRVVYLEQYRDRGPLDKLQEAGIVTEEVG